MQYQSWGRFPRHKQNSRNYRIGQELSDGSKTFLPRGLGRSYGDVCLNQSGVLIATSGLTNFLSFDTESGVLRAESGVSLADVLELVVPKGWFLPVTPGTKFVTLGGAVANDVHGKNHHTAGTFGCHVLGFDLLRSDGSFTHCTPNENAPLFRATIGGMGLTGLITSVEIQLKKIQNPFIESEAIQFSGIEEFYSLSDASDKEFEYTVAWIDCIATGENLGRGVFLRGNHSSIPTALLPKVKKPLTLSVPCTPPVNLLGSFSVGIFNTLYYNKQFQKRVSKTTYFDPFFYPLDAVIGWNKLYGPGGFIQFQCVLPQDAERESLREILRLVAESKKASFLAVLKNFGSKASPGLLSFPMAGPTLCLDFPYQGEKTHQLYRTLEKVVVECGGRLYPAKDALMESQSFRKGFKDIEEFMNYCDPLSSSEFWERMELN